MKANRLYHSRLGKYLNVYLCLGPSCFYFYFIFVCVGLML